MEREGAQALGRSEIGESLPWLERTVRPMSVAVCNAIMASDLRCKQPV